MQVRKPLTFIFSTFSTLSQADRVNLKWTDFWHRRFRQIGLVAPLPVVEDPEKKDELNVFSHKEGLSAFYESGKDLLAQYCKIMKPVAICLDTLQSEENAYMGTLLPNLKLMKDQVAALRTDVSIVEGQEFINYLLENHDKPRVAFKGRFEHPGQGTGGPNSTE